MNNDVVEMTVKINQTAISHDLTEDGWTLGMVLTRIRLNFLGKPVLQTQTKDDVNGVYTKTWAANEFADEEVSVDANNNLVLSKTVNTDCPKVILRNLSN